MQPSSSGNPVSRLFLSCDLTGSTNFKQNLKPNAKAPWQKVFLSFYREFPQAVATAQHELGFSRPQFDLWKPVGDELIYTCDVRSERDIYEAVRIWTRAMKDYYEGTLKDDTSMGTKGGAFVATFPGPDSESTVPRNPTIESSDADVVMLNRQALDGQRDHDQYLYDYFGPSIDTGFRVTSQCDSRYFTLSVEVALAMLSRQLTPDLGQEDFTVDDLVLHRTIELKGVWRGREYPIFAIDTQHDDAVHTALRTINPSPVPNHLYTLCMACYTSEGWPSQLYLPECSNNHFNQAPVDALADYKAQSSVGAEDVAEDDPDGQDELPSDAPLG
ncbi:MULTISPECIES: hypothetical protein [unclassified Rhodococcus (in: high G+C Gram-positive bacteria)]|uniref:hypothetical protein n=1 Tax=unclassified Rhodococcus (in: high G+C Gram-positive bacteria) TaxID=192944 RepID=UPI00117B1057|nr:MULTISPECIES: hypothetical protein [unclassified Rhodococcus (in: high G+C Gram-positive bacteria)]